LTYLHPLNSSRGFFVFSSKKKAPGIHLGGSVGTESRERTPSAVKPIFKKFTGPFAGLVLVATQISGNEQSNSETLYLSIPAPAPPWTENIIPFQVELLTDQEQIKESQVVQAEPEVDIRIDALGLMKEMQIEPSSDLVKMWLSQGGWPQELHNEALSVVFCESRNKPWAKSDNDLYRGLFGLSELWFDYSGENWENWADPVVNSKVAYATYLYDIKKNQPAWTQWMCKPKL
jgi:hypothetical protein